MAESAASAPYVDCTTRVGCCEMADAIGAGVERVLMLMPGTRFGAHEIVTSLGAGGVGEVYRARDTRLGRDVAIKLLPENLAHDPEWLRTTAPFSFGNPVKVLDGPYYSEPPGPT